MGRKDKPAIGKTGGRWGGGERCQTGLKANKRWRGGKRRRQSLGSSERGSRFPGGAMNPREEIQERKCDVEMVPGCWSAQVPLHSTITHPPPPSRLCRLFLQTFHSEPRSSYVSQATPMGGQVFLRSGSVGRGWTREGLGGRDKGLGRSPDRAGEQRAQSRLLCFLLSLSLSGARARALSLLTQARARVRAWAEKTAGNLGSALESGFFRDVCP
ncbi:hypothetical protein LX36DRAFT_244424 [Colletotrichum falcatum]|nr:hypothetical protein LX36DRAFT_244424 [Colletotrichum falcatum]